jgi:hypothetical protein
MSLIVRVPVCPASDGNRFWKVIRIVGTSRTQTVPAAPNVNVSGRVVVDEVDDVVVLDAVVGGTLVDVDVVVVDAVVVLAGTVVDEVAGSVDDVDEGGVVVLVDVVDGGDELVVVVATDEDVVDAAIVVDVVDVGTSVVVVVNTTVPGVQSGHVVVVGVGVDVGEPVEVGYVIGVVVDVGCEYPATAADAQPVSATSSTGSHRRLT